MGSNRKNGKKKGQDLLLLSMVGLSTRSRVTLGHREREARKSGGKILYGDISSDWKLRPGLESGVDDIPAQSDKERRFKRGKRKLPGVRATGRSSPLLGGKGSATLTPKKLLNKLAQDHLIEID